MQLRTKRYLLPSLIAAVSVTQFMIVATDGALGVKGSWHIKAPGTFSGTNRYHHFSNKAKMLDISVNRDVAKKLRIRGGGANEQEKGMSSSASIFNLVNNMAGAGILTLSSGVARGTGSIPAIVICSVLGFLSAHCVSMVGESCELTGESDFKGLWGRTMGEKSTYVVDSMIAILCLSCAVVYSGILGDVFTPLLRQAGFPDHLNGRTSNIIVITLFFLLPLSLIKDLSALAFTSILGSAAVLYSVLFIIWRSLDGSYRLPYGNFLEDGLIIPPSFKRKSLWNVDFTSLVLASNFGLAYVAHYNAPIFYRSLRNTNARRFRSMVDKSFFILVCLYSATMMAGYVTFGDVCQGNILLNYHPNDVLATLGRIATGYVNSLFVVLFWIRRDFLFFHFVAAICESRENKNFF